MAQVQVSMDQFLRLSKRLDEFAQKVNGDIVFKMFPVGSLYLSLTMDSPAGFFGGQWERFAKGCCIVGVDPNDTDFAQAGHVVGAKTVSLTAAQNGAHTHTQNAHTHTQNAHTHTQNAHTHTQNIHAHSIPALSGTAASAGAHNHGIGYNGDAAAGSGKPRIAGSDYTAIAMDVIQSNGAHSHSVTTIANISGGTTAMNQNATATNQNATATNQNTTATNQSSGSGVPHNNIQPSVAVYIWVRVA